MERFLIGKKQKQKNMSRVCLSCAVIKLLRWTVEWCELFLPRKAVNFFSRPCFWKQQFQVRTCWHRFALVFYERWYLQPSYENMEVKVALHKPLAHKHYGEHEVGSKCMCTCVHLWWFDTYTSCLQICQASLCPFPPWKRCILKSSSEQLTQTKKQTWMKVWTKL